MVADMCRAAAKVSLVHSDCTCGPTALTFCSLLYPHFCFQCHPAESLKVFVPHCCNAINQIAVSKCSPYRDKHFYKSRFSYADLYFLSWVFVIYLMYTFFSDEEVLNEEELDKELLWNLQLLSEVIYILPTKPLCCCIYLNRLSIMLYFTLFFPQVTRVDGDKILSYRSDLVQILQLTLHLKCKQGYTLACNLLHHILRSSALIYPTEYCSVPGGFHQPISDYLPIKVLSIGCTFN